MKTSETTMTLANVYKRFGDIEAVNDVTFSVGQGEVVGFVGPNGAGKSTTVSMLMGYLSATKGTVTILGETVEPHTAHKVHSRVGYVAGDMVLPGTLTGKQFLGFMAKQNGRDEARYEILESQLSPVLSRPLHTLSRGNKQKIALIAALQHNPTILILDEPTSGLDPLMQEVFLSAIVAEAQRGTTVLMSSHILSEVSSICSRILFMRSGKIVLDKPIEHITSQLGKQVTITSPDVHKLKSFLPDGMKVVSHEGNVLKATVPPKQLKSFLQWIATKNITDLTVEDRELDDIFHELYTPNRKGVNR